MSSLCSEELQDIPTEDLLERFGSDPRAPNRPKKLFYKDGEMFIRGEEDSYHHYPKQSSFIPAHCKGELAHSLEAWDTSTLCFYCYAEEDGWEGEIHRIRSFKLYYHLADGTFSMMEPHVDNSGMLQGRHFRRQKVPNPSRLGGPYLHWRDMNLGIDVEIFGTRYRITNCDDFTRKFMEEHGAKLNPPEAHPEDPWTVRRRPRERETAVEKELLPRHFLPRPAQLHFRCCWLDDSNDFHGCKIKRTFVLTVFCLDDTVSLTEETREYEGQLFLRRIHLPRPMEQDGLRRFYKSWDFRPGIWIDVFSRPMFIYECVGEQTKQFMTQQFGEVDFRQCTNEVLIHGPPPMTFERAPSQLKFYAKMLDPPPQLAGIGFILTYHVNSKKVDIVEAGRQRKWSSGRSFLMGIDASTFSENQFNFGQILHFFKWRFQLIEADRETTEYLHWRGQK